MAVSKNDERRKCSRVAFTTDIHIHLETKDKEIEIQGYSKNLSLNGIFVNTDERIELETTCEIRIRLTGSVDKIELQIKGRVARISNNGMGIVFDSMDVDSYSHLKNIVQYNSIDNSD